MMDTKIASCWVAGMLYVISMGLAWGGTEGTESTFYGHNAGLVNSDDANENTFIGAGAGHDNTTGIQNTFLGRHAGYSTVNGSYNTFLGRFAGQANNSSYNTFVGHSAGSANTTGTGNAMLGTFAGNSNTTGNYNTFLGVYAGGANTGAASNTLVGSAAGYSIAGEANTAVGASAGYSTTGAGNVFLGAGAGYSETGSNRLYIDNCLVAGCNSPLIYGEFDNHLLMINGVLNVHANGEVVSQMHFSQSNTDTGGFLTSVLDNNFFVSSGARYDSGNWVQRSADTNAVMAGSGGVGYRIFTHTGTAVGNTFNNPTLRLHIDYSGQFGINHAPVAGDEIHTSSGAHLTSGGVWTDASSRKYKEHIADLSAADAMTTLAALQPVTYNYKVDAEEKHVGFIAEDVPDLVATKDRTSLAPMDIVAVLTKVVQEKSLIVDAQRAALGEQKSVIAQQRQMLESIEARLAALEVQAVRK